VIPAFIRRAEPDQVEHLMQITPVVAAGATLGALFVWMRFASAVEGASIDAWFAGFALISAARIAASVCFLKRRPATSRYRLWLVWASVGALAHASCWIVFAILVTQPGNAAAETILHVVVAAIAMGATMHLAGFYSLLVTYVLFTLVPLILRDLHIGGAEHLTLAGLCVIIALYSLLTSGGHARALAQMLAQRRQNAALILALKKENKAAIEARELAEQANASKVRLFAAANHDLRQPLHAAALLAASLTRARSLDDVRPVAQRIGSCIDSLGDLVDAMLELSQLDSGAVKPQIDRFEIGGLIGQVIAANEPQASAKGLALRADQTPVWVKSDRKMVLRVLSNLVNNAVRYTRAGQVQVGLREEGDSVVVSVRDTGPGIPADKLPRIFEEFYQADNPARDRQRGLGLGLATSQRISDNLGLGLTVRSELGVGSEFSFVLPVNRVQEGQSPETEAIELVEGFSARRVLVVEDDTESREAVELVLLRCGCDLSVQTATDFKEALRQVEQGFVPELILTDQRLGARMDGLTLIRVLRERLGRPVPAILMTGDATTNTVRRDDHGKTVVLRKPIKAVQLRSILEGAFESALRSPARGWSEEPQQHRRAVGA
jgi:two-component system, sensor histidine kinase